MSNRTKIDFQQLKKCFIIAEIGQNHQGNIELAKQMIHMAKDCGADCVKFQKTDLNAKFTKTALNRPYISENSFGSTYGEHKQFLEFSKDEFTELQAVANDVNILFSASAMDLKSLQFLVSLDLPFIKIGSGDANNFLLIEKAAQTNIPLIISTGMQDFDTVKKIYQTVKKYHTNFALLHCVSSYPTPIEDINLNVITLYKREFPDITIGYSGHELGTSISTAAVSMGAKIIERHITTDKRLKGSDHQCSLEPEEFDILVKNIRNLETALGKPEKMIQQSEMPCYEKLGKTLVFSRSLCKGHILTLDDMNAKVDVPKGIDGSKYHCFIGKSLQKYVEKDEQLNDNLI